MPTNLKYVSDQIANEYTNPVTKKINSILWRAYTLYFILDTVFSSINLFVLLRAPILWLNKRSWGLLLDKTNFDEFEYIVPQ